MVVKSTLACGLQKSIGNLWKGDDFSDFTVVVENATFHCHRFILSACSSFFQGLFRSEMKEWKEKKASVGGMTASTFDVILNSLYKGIDSLTEDNVLDVWSATVQLQIGYLTEECENYVIKNMSVDSCFIVLNHATMYSAKRVVDHTLDFISKHFEQVRKRENLLELSYDYFYKIIENDYLTASSEDVVLEAVMKWMDYTPSLKQDSQVSDENITSDASSKSEETKDSLTCLQVVERTVVFDIDSSSKNLDGTQILHGESLNDSAKDTLIISQCNIGSESKRNNDDSALSCVREDREKHLFQLISVCRLFLISSTCLEYLLLNNKTILCYKKTYELLFKAMMYGLRVERRHDPWPELAVHRLSSSMKHGMVFVSHKKCKFYNLNNGSLHEFADLPDDSRRLTTTTITVFDNNLYLDYLNKDGQVLSIYAKDGPWQLITYYNSWNVHSFMLAHGSCIYGLLGNTIECCHVLGHNRHWSSCSKLNQSVGVLVKFTHYILAFYTENNVVSAQCYNTKTEEIHVGTTLMDGTSKDMASFSHHGDVFILRRNGSLWKIVSSDREPVDFELISKLWDQECNLRGCVVYKKQLFVFYLEDHEMKTITFWTSLPGIFNCIKIVAVKTDTPCLPMVVPQSWFTA